MPLGNSQITVLPIAPQIDVAILVCPGYNPVDIIGVHTVQSRLSIRSIGAR